MICVYFFLPSRGGAIIASREHSFPSEIRNRTNPFRKIDHTAKIRFAKSTTLRTCYANKGATRFGTVALSLNADITLPLDIVQIERAVPTSATYS
jgi:hypothetical protein